MQATLGRRVIVAAIGVVCLLPNIALLMLGPSALFGGAGNHDGAMLLVDYAIDILGVVGIILILLAWLVMQRPSVPRSPDGA